MTTWLYFDKLSDGFKLVLVLQVTSLLSTTFLLPFDRAILVIHLANICDKSTLFACMSKDTLRFSRHSHHSWRYNLHILAPSNYHCQHQPGKVPLFTFFDKPAFWKQWFPMLILARISKRSRSNSTRNLLLIVLKKLQPIFFGFEQLLIRYEWLS